MDTPSSETETTTTGTLGGDSSTTKTTSAVSAEIETAQKIRFCCYLQKWVTTHHSGLESSIFVRDIADVKPILVNAPESVFNGDMAMI